MQFVQCHEPVATRSKEGMSDEDHENLYNIKSFVIGVGVRKRAFQPAPVLHLHSQALKFDDCCSWCSALESHVFFRQRKTLRRVKRKLRSHLTQNFERVKTLVYILGVLGAQFHESLFFFVLFFFARYIFRMFGSIVFSSQRLTKLNCIGDILQIRYVEYLYSRNELRKNAPCETSAFNRQTM